MYSNSLRSPAVVWQLAWGPMNVQLIENYQPQHKPEVALQYQRLRSFFPKSLVDDPLISASRIAFDGRDGELYITENQLSFVAASGEDPVVLRIASCHSIKRKGNMVGSDTITIIMRNGEKHSLRMSGEAFAQMMQQWELVRIVEDEMIGGRSSLAHQGYLMKRREGGQWHPRYAVLRDGAFRYYKDASDTNSTPAGCIGLVAFTPLCDGAVISLCTFPGRKAALSRQLMGN